MPTEQALTFVNHKIQNNKVVVFSKTYCPYCIKAKKALASLVQPDQMEIIELDTIQPGGGEPTIVEIQDALYEVTGARSVPRVFVGGEFIGGGDDTAAKAASGELAAKLRAIGV